MGPGCHKLVRAVGAAGAWHGTAWARACVGPGLWRVMRVAWHDAYGWCTPRMAMLPQPFGWRGVAVW